MPAETLPENSLCPLSNVKERLAITDNGFDQFLIRKLKEATTFIENTCNRKFKRATYTNQIYSVEGGEYVLLEQTPVVVGSLSMQYRAGIPSTPGWTAFLTDQYELLEDGESGLVRVYGGAGSFGDNGIRATYQAGYLIDWSNVNDEAAHNLPADLTLLCENLVVRWFKRRDNGDKTQESFNGSTVYWQKELSSEDQQTLDRYGKLPRFI